MIFLIIYVFIVLVELVIVTYFMIFTISLIYSSVKGSPYVPTRNKEIEVILEEANLKKGSYFLELGCGDGRVVRKAVCDYRVRGLGIDVNPLLTITSTIYTKLKKIKHLHFKTQNIFNLKLTPDLKKANFIYLFLMPQLLEKLSPVLKKACKKKTIIISHGFRIEELDKLLVKKLDRHPFPTYYYKIN